MINAIIETENLGNIDNDNIRFLVTISSEQNGLTGELFRGEARMIVSGNSFHLNSELEDDCELFGIEPFDLQVSLEARSNTVKMAKLSQYYQPTEAFLEKMGIPSYYVWSSSTGCIQDLGIPAYAVLTYTLDDIEEPRFVDGNEDLLQMFLGKEPSLERETVSYTVSQAEFDTCLNFYRNAFDFDSAEPFISIQLDEEHKVEIYRDESRQPDPIYFGVETISGEDIPLNDLACNEFLDFIVHEMHYVASDFVVFSPDLSSVDYPTSAQIIVDVKYNLQTLIDTGETAQSMASYAQGVIENEIGNGMLSAGNYEVEINSYDISVVKPSKVKETPFLATESNSVEMYSVSEKAFKSSAKRLREGLVELGIDIGHAKSLQLLSQSIYVKPFEELKATILTEKSQEETDKEVEKGHVYIVDYPNESMLFVNGEFVTATFTGTDVEVPFHSLLAQAEREASRLSCEVIRTKYDGNLPDEWEYSDLEGIFLVSGVIEDGNPSMIREMEAMESGVIIDGKFLVKYGLDGDWQNDFSEGSDIDNTIWHPEATSEDGFYEWFVSAREMQDAKKVDGEWHVRYSEKDDYTMTVIII